MKIKLLIVSLMMLVLAPMYALAAGEVSRATFTSSVVDREPIDQKSAFDNSVSTIYFFTELSNLNGQTVTHVWSYNGVEMAKVELPVHSNRWRAWSSKNLIPMWIGKWTVSVLDGSGKEIHMDSFAYSAPQASLK